MGFAYRGFGVLALREGDLSSAESNLNQSISLFKELGTRGDLAESLTNMGKLYLCRSEFNEAQIVLKEAIRLGLDSNAMPQVYEAAIELADCLLNLNRRQDASAILNSIPDSALKVESLRARAAAVREEIGVIAVQMMKFDEVLIGLVK